MWSTRRVLTLQSIGTPTFLLLLTRHGLGQRGSPFSDGTPESQFQIRPNDTYIYEFLLQEDAGTYFYHSHVGAPS